MEAGIILAIAEGEIGIEEFRVYRNRLAADPLYDPDLAILIDSRNGILNIGSDDAFSLGDWTRTTSRFSKFAIVGQEGNFGTMRMLLGWAGDEYNGQIFHDIASAREWLGLPPEEG